jgi:hypothetical protein
LDRPDGSGPRGAGNSAIPKMFKCSENGNGMLEFLVLEEMKDELYHFSDLSKVYSRYLDPEHMSVKTVC